MFVCFFFPRSFGEAKPRGFQTRGFPSFSGKVRSVLQTLSGLFLVGAFHRINRLRKRIGKIPEKSGKSRQIREGPKRGPKKGQVQTGKPPHVKPRLVALEISGPLSPEIADP